MMETFCSLLLDNPKIIYFVVVTFIISVNTKSVDYINLPSFIGKSIHTPSKPPDKNSLRINRDVQKVFLRVPIYFLSGAYPVTAP